MQYIDCSVLDVQTLQFAPKILVCSFMYLVLGIFFAYFKERITSNGLRKGSLKNSPEVHIIWCSKKECVSLINFSICFWPIHLNLT